MFADYRPFSTWNDYRNNTGKHCFVRHIVRSRKVGGVLFFLLSYSYVRDTSSVERNYQFPSPMERSISPFTQRNYYLYSQASRSNYRGYYLHVLKYLLLLYLSRNELSRLTGLQTSVIFSRNFHSSTSASLLVCITPFSFSIIIINTRGDVNVYDN